MNLYALNATPINGWETHFGSGKIAVSLVASGVSANVDLGAGNAQISLGASGNGTRRVPASGSMSLEIMAQGDGVRRVPATGIGFIEFAASGDGEIVSGLGGQAQIQLRATGHGGLLVQGAGVAGIRLALAGDGRVAKAHFGSSHWIMETRAWDIPKRYDTYHGQGAAPVRLSLRGTSTAVTVNVGAAAIGIQLAGAGRLAQRVHGAGKATIELRAARSQSDQHRQVFATGSASLSINFTTRDNRICMLPASFYPAPHARGMRVTNDHRGMRVMAQPAQRLAEA